MEPPQNEPEFQFYTSISRGLQVFNRPDSLWRVLREYDQLNRDFEANPTAVVSAPMIVWLESPRTLPFSGLCSSRASI